MDQEREMVLTDMNTLHYAAAGATTGTSLTECVQTTPDHNPNATIKKHIKSVCNITGRLLSIQRRGKINKKMMQIIGDKTIESVLKIIICALQHQVKNAQQERNSHPI